MGSAVTGNAGMGSSVFDDAVMDSIAFGYEREQEEEEDGYNIDSDDTGSEGDSEIGDGSDGDAGVRGSAEEAAQTLALLSLSRSVGADGSTCEALLRFACPFTGETYAVSELRPVYLV